jgi:hypothetical protein
MYVDRVGNAREANFLIPKEGILSGLISPLSNYGINTCCNLPYRCHFLVESKIERASKTPKGPARQ